MRQTPTETYQYDAFISYRHTEPDITVAKKLIEMLEGYKPPRSISKTSGVKRIRRVFRDREELPTTTDLSESIQNALISSGFLIVICSPRTPQSEWVNKEIEIFKEIHGADRIQALLIEGEPGESFPQSLQQEVIKTVRADGSIEEQIRELELLAADIRPDELKGKNRLAYGASDKNDRMLLSKSLRLLKTEILRCLAPMFGCKFDQLFQRHLKKRIRNIVSVSAAVIILMASLTIYTLTMSRQIANQRDNALRSQSLFLSDLSEQEFAKGDRVVAAMLALEALPSDLSNPDRPYVKDAEAALWNATNCSADPYIPYTMLKHDSYINSARFNYDNSKIVTASDDRTAAVWDAKTGREISKMEGHTGKVVYAEFSPDGKKVVTSSDDKTAIIWDAETGKKLAVLTGCKKEVYHAVFSPDGSKVLQATFDDFAILWDAATGEVLYRLKNGDSQFFSAEFSLDGRRVVTTDNSSAVIIWDVQTGKPLVRVDYPHEETKSDAKFSPDGNRVLAMNISGDTTNAAVILDANTGKLLNTLDGHDKYLLDTGFSKDGGRVITCSQDDRIIIWDTSTGSMLKQLENDGKDLLDAYFSPDGRTIVSEYQEPDLLLTVLWDSTTYGELTRFSSETISDYEYFYTQLSSDGGKMIAEYDNKSVLIWDTNGDNDITRLSAQNGFVSGLDYSTDGSCLLTTSNDGKAVIWGPAKGEMLGSLNFGVYAGYNSVFSPDCSKVAVCSDDGSAIVWDVKSRKEIARLRPEDGETCYVAFSPDSKRIVTSSGYETAVVWDASTGTEVFRIESDISIFHAEYTPDGGKIVTIPFSGQSGGLAEIWDSETGRLVARLSETVSLNNAVVSYGGKMIATVLMGKTVIWDMKTGRKLSEYSVSDYDFGITNCVFSPDDRRLVTILATKAPIVWNTKTGSKLFELDGHNDVVNSAKYSRDGKWIVTASNDGTAIVWDASTGKEAIRLQGRNKAIDNAVFSPDGKMVATIYEDATSSIWSVDNGIELEKLQGVNTLFSPDSKNIATAMDDGTVVIWPVKRLEDSWSYAQKITEGRSFTEQEKKEFFLK